MKILTNIDNELYRYGKITKGLFPKVDPDTELYRIEQDGAIFWAVAYGFKEYEVESIPQEVKDNTEKYCYTPDKGFYENPIWVEPDIPIEKKVSNLEDYTSDLLYQVCLLQLGVDDTSETTATE